MRFAALPSVGYGIDQRNARIKLGKVLATLDQKFAEAYDLASRIFPVNHGKPIKNPQDAICGNPDGLIGNLIIFGNAIARLPCV